MEHVLTSTAMQSRLARPYPAHIASNAAIFDFSLSDDDMALLAAATQPAGAPGDCAVA